MKDFAEKIKDGGEAVTEARILTPLLIVLVGAGSFGLGRMSVTETESPEPVRIVTAPLSATQSASAAVPLLGEASVSGTSTGSVAAEGKLVASKNGTKYHFPWCSGAARIADENKIWFNSAEEAKAKGYAPASNCKGLE